jgi:hypothetical protein
MKIRKFVKAIKASFVVNTNLWEVTKTHKRADGESYELSCDLGCSLSKGVYGDGKEYFSAYGLKFNDSESRSFSPIFNEFIKKYKKTEKSLNRKKTIRLQSDIVNNLTKKSSIII